MLETKIIISYIVICVAYSLCRLHYLITVKSDEEFNSMLSQLIDLAGSRDIVKVLVDDYQDYTIHFFLGGGDTKQNNLWISLFR